MADWRPGVGAGASGIDPGESLGHGHHETVADGPRRPTEIRARCAPLAWLDALLVLKLAVSETPDSEVNGISAVGKTNIGGTAPFRMEAPAQRLSTASAAAQRWKRLSWHGTHVYPLPTCRANYINARADQIDLAAAMAELRSTRLPGMRHIRTCSLPEAPRFAVVRQRSAPHECLPLRGPGRRSQPER